MGWVYYKAMLKLFQNLDHEIRVALDVAATNEFYREENYHL